MVECVMAGALTLMSTLDAQRMLRQKWILDVLVVVSALFLSQTTLCINNSLVLAT